MKCAVVYCSQTQNTEKITKCIQKGVEAAAGNCEPPMYERVDTPAGSCRSGS